MQRVSLKRPNLRSDAVLLKRYISAVRRRACRSYRFALLALALLASAMARIEIVQAIDDASEKHRSSRYVDPAL
jgi:hypothetical protein